jgi:hypothetical protein
VLALVVLEALAGGVFTLAVVVVWLEEVLVLAPPDP